MKKNLAFLWTIAATLLLVGCSTADSGNTYYESIMMNDALAGEPQMPRPDGDKFEEYQDNPFVSVAEQPASTFSVDADGASYAITRRHLNAGFRMNASGVRIEELLNYFTFNYPSPKGDDMIAINAEVGDCPWNTKHHLVRLGIKGKELTANETPLANYVFLVDVSGSMSGRDRLDLLKSGLTQLLYQLNPEDRISLITYSGEVKKLLESTSVKEVGKIKDAISKLHADGCTAGGEALKMAYEEALANYDPKKNNRVIMGTDGDFNVGVTNTEALVEMVESYARKGIYMTCLGFGLGNLNDSMMEKVSNSGNGTYYYIDSENEMMKVFVHERERFVAVANDTKCQVTFNKDIVSQYRLIGYENRVMSNEDFEDDKKDAGEIGAGQTITALYEIVLNEDDIEDVFQPFVTFDCRYKKALGEKSIALQKKLTADQIFNKNERSSEYYFAAGVAAWGMILRDSPYKGNATLEMAKKLAQLGLNFDPHGYRGELIILMDKEP